MNVKGMESKRRKKLRHRPMTKHKMAEGNITVMATLCETLSMSHG
jgi:hypothetical protein